MARAYSVDLRERVVAAVGEGQSCREAELRERDIVVALDTLWRVLRAGGISFKKPCSLAAGST
jgi:transposase